MDNTNNCSVCKNKSQIPEKGQFGNCEFYCRHGQKCTFSVLFQCYGCQKGICRYHHNTLDVMSSFCADCRIDEYKKKLLRCSYKNCNNLRELPFGTQCSNCNRWICQDHHMAIQFNNGHPMCDDCICSVYPSNFV